MTEKTKLELDIELLRHIAQEEHAAGRPWPIIIAIGKRFAKVLEGGEVELLPTIDS